ncbi:hypothetical protein BV22DRAFT_1075903 [Leucogyrophana mollusca]|uniref:Uncharacterized protein n=2 Tax=Leucogyrophana mollusca TaxID=85980 RepID=A0ACB8AZ09_9AGAM|nr:hypothetical protein BV22DRAFT_1076293 [Leucogyrophana mollusca]KAH7918801.1 hypothetical protein BV22DRAFT_1075903 [Leucogyrophana mollusca]
MRTTISDALDGLAENGVKFSEVLNYVFDANNTTPQWRWDEVFSNPTCIRQVLDFCASKNNSATGRRSLTAWATNYILSVVDDEATEITKSGILRATGREVNASFALGLDFGSLAGMMRQYCPTIMKILACIATTERQEKSGNADLMLRKDFIAASECITLLKERSQMNSYPGHVLGLWLYSTGASRQQISVFNHFGKSVSYSTLAGSGTKHHDDLDRTRVAGTLELLSQSMRTVARTVAAGGLFLTVYDNINMVWKVAEQIVGRTDSQENGTCATIVPLFGACPDDVKATELNESFDKAPPLSIDDILINGEEQQRLRKHLIHTVLRIAVHHGGPKLRIFHKEVYDSAPWTNHKIDVHKTDIHPLPAMNIEEASTAGNAEVIEAILKELKLDTSKASFTDIAKLIAGDQLSIARLRSVAATRAGNEGGASALRWAVFVPGLFHYKIAATHGIMAAHLGLINHDIANPASLSAHNTALRRKPILLSSLPPFRTCRDLIFVSLYARVLHCLLLLSGKDSLDSYGDDLTWFDLRQHAEKLVDEYTNVRAVAKLRRARQKGGPKCGDMVYENAILFLRDALLLREFTDAVKAGDSGRVVLVLKMWALSYRGSGRTKYAHEMLFLLHNITHVWPKSMVDVVLKNWLVNPTGHPNSFIEVDLLQEHLNFWIKDYYQAHGSGASWEWLATIAPCVDILRQLATNISGALGSKQGNRHAAPDLTEDIDELMGSLSHHNVYKKELGRAFDDGDLPTADVVEAGFMALSWGMNSALNEYNNDFKTLQQRRRVTPLVPTGNQITAPSLPLQPMSQTNPDHSGTQQQYSATLDEDTSDSDSDGENAEDAESSLVDDLQTGIRPALDLVTADDVALDMDGYDDRGGIDSDNEWDAEEEGDI